MNTLEKLYRSPLGRVMSQAARLALFFHKPRMIYGYKDPKTRVFRKFVRMSSTVSIVDNKNLSIGDHVWIWHHSILDATAGLDIGEGCQIGAWVGIFTHSSHNAIRLLGKHFVDISNSERPGYVRRPVKIGAYTFVSSGSVILPGVTIGSGCVIGPHSLIASDVPDHAIFMDTPARSRGDTLATDEVFFRESNPLATDYYYDPALVEHLRRKLEASK